MNKPPDLSDLSQARQFVIESEQYQSECTKLFPIFEASRESQLNPYEYHNLQTQIFDNIIRFQQHRLKSSSDLNEKTLYELLIHVNRSIADSLAWRMLGYNRFLAELCFSRNSPGHLKEESGKVELQKAYEIIQNEGSHVIINDLTRFLRYGDLTVLGQQQLRLVEVKTAGNRAASSRITRQKQELTKLNSLFSGNSKTIEVDGIEQFIIQIRNANISSMHESLGEAIELARQSGYGIIYPRPFIAIEVFDQDKGFSKSNPIPFKNNRNKVSRFSSVLPTFPLSNWGSSAPFGIFPLSNQDCFGLITGHLAMNTSMDLSGLAAMYQQVGITLKVYEPTQEEITRYENAIQLNPTGSKEKAELIEQGIESFVLEDQKTDLKIKGGREHFLKILLDLITPEDFVFAERFRIDQVMKLIEAGTFRVGESNLHLNFDERSIWR